MWSLARLTLPWVLLATPPWSYCECEGGPIMRRLPWQTPKKAKASSAPASFATFFLAWPWRRVAHEGWLSVKVCRAGFPSPRLPPAPLGSGHPNPFGSPRRSAYQVPLRFPATPLSPGYPTPFRAFRAPDTPGLPTLGAHTPLSGHDFPNPGFPCAAVSSRSFVALHPVGGVVPIPFRCQPARPKPL